MRLTINARLAVYGFEICGAATAFSFSCKIRSDGIIDLYSSHVGGETQKNILTILL